MRTVIRIYNGDQILDMPFPESGVYSIGGTGKDDYIFPHCKKRGTILIRKTGSEFKYSAAKLENAENKGVIQKETIYVFDSNRAQGFALFDRDVRAPVIVNLGQQSQVTIGRRDDCSIVIHSNQISRRHAKLENAIDGWYIQDLGSANGTYVNGRSVEFAFLQEGDVIDVSFCKIIFQGEAIEIESTGRVEVNITHVKQIRRYEESSGYPFFFKRSPRIKKEITNEEIEIQNAPMLGSAPNINWLSVLVTPLASVLLMTMMVVFFRFSKISLLFSGPMAILGAITAVMNYRSQVKKYRGKEKARLAQYDSYLSGIEEQLKQNSSKQRNILSESHPTVTKCVEMVTSIDRQLWGKRIQDHDFLTLRIGSGEVESSVRLKIPREVLSLDTDALSTLPGEIREKYQLVPNCPITIDILRNTTVGIVGERNTAVATAKNLLVQAATHHSYDELKIVMIFDNTELRDWEFVKWLPHTFDQTRTQRYIANDEKSLNKLLRTMEDLVDQRCRETVPFGRNDGGIAPQSPYYLFVFANYDMVKGRSIIKKICKSDPNAGVGALLLFDSIYNLPQECGMIVEVQGSDGKAYPRERANDVVFFEIETLKHHEYDTFARAMAPIRIESTGNNSLPTSISFLQGYRIKRPKDYGIERAWLHPEPDKSMAVPIGVRSNGEPFMFDIHEKKHGPHGLVAGMTGSGKSEMVQTWILAMALKFPPDEVSFVLIDFKGTGLILPFRNLPHLAGTISDLDTNIGRNLIALENELTRRKALLDAYGVSNIASYKKLYREGRASEPLSYLFVVIDEFAEFKVQFPEFMTVVNRIFAIGRTLGVSIILLTQKPTNVVDDKMNANTRFRWCLKVASSVDSKEMIGHPDAAKITNPGRAVVRIGEDEIFETIQSYYSGASFNPYRDFNSSGIDKVAVVDLQGNRVTYEVEKTTGYRSNKNEIDAIVEFLDKYVRSNGLNRARNIWVQKLPEMVFLRQMLTVAFDGERWAEEDPGLQVPVGLIDNPRSQSQYPLRINFSDEGHLAVFGAPGTGKTTFLQTTAISLALTYSPEILHLYMMDFGGGNLKLLQDLPHVGGVALADDEERVTKLAQMLESELHRRKGLFSACGAMNIQTYTELTGEKLPFIVVLLDNFAPVLSLYPNLDMFFISLSREGAAYGLYWVVTANNVNSLTFRISQNFRNMIALRMTDKGDYATIVGRTDGLEPENVLGRGLAKGKPPLEFQTALAAEGNSESERIKNLRNMVNLMNARWNGTRPAEIPVMPEKVSLTSLKGKDIAIGLTTNTIERLSYNPSEYPFVAVSVGSGADGSFFESALYEQYRNTKHELFLSFDGTNGLAEDSSGHQRKLISPSAFDTEIENLMPLMQRRKALKERDSEQLFSPVIVYLSNIGDCFESISDETAKRLNLLATLGKDLNVLMVVSGTNRDLSRLYNSGAAFVMNIVNAGTGIALGENFRAHSIFRANLSYSEQDVRVPSDEGYFIKAGNAVRFKAIST